MGFCPGQKYTKHTTAAAPPGCIYITRLRANFWKTTLAISQNIYACGILLINNLQRVVIQAVTYSNYFIIIVKWPLNIFNFTNQVFIINSLYKRKMISIRLYFARVLIIILLVKLYVQFFKFKPNFFYFFSIILVIVRCFSFR